MFQENTWRNEMNNIIDVDDLEIDVAPNGAAGSVIIEIIFVVYFWY
jgi:hypothetical protein